METITQIHEKILNSQSSEEIFKVLSEFKDLVLEENYSIGNIATIVNDSIKIIESNHGLNISQQEALMILEYFGNFVSINNFRKICQIAISRLKNVHDIILLLYAIEEYSEIKKDDNLFHQIEEIVMNLNENDMSLVMQTTIFMDFQENILFAINLKKLSKERQELLLKSEKWSCISPVVAMDLYNTFNRGTITNELRMQFLKIFDCVSYSDNNSNYQIPIRTVIRNLCDLIIENNPNLEQAMAVESCLSSHFLISIQDRIKISETVYILCKDSPENCITFGNHGNFILQENSIQALSLKYKIPTEKILTVKYTESLNLDESDNELLNSIRGTDDFKIYLIYRQHKEADKFWEKNKKGLQL